MRPFSMITVASMSPWRDVPQPEKVPSFHLRPVRGVVSAGVVVGAGAGAGIGAGAGAGSGAAAGATAGATAGVTVAVGEIGAAGAAIGAVPAVTALLLVPATATEPSTREGNGGDADACASTLSCPAGEAALTSPVAVAPLAARFSETSDGDVAPDGSVTVSSGDGGGGRRRPLLRTASASAASLVRL